MRLLRFGPEGSERPGILDENGGFRALGPLSRDILPEVLSPEGLAFLAALDPSAGVGLGRRPPQFLKQGDLLEMSITGLGTQRHKVTAD
jgi:hypothetical protein